MVLLLLLFSPAALQPAATQPPPAGLEQSNGMLIPNIGYYLCDSLHPECPMGLADYGVNDKNLYRYNSTEFVSWRTSPPSR